MRILITGATGLLGINLALTAQSLGHEVYGVSLDQGIQNLPFPLSRVDLTHRGTVSKILEVSNPEVVFNCIALTDVDHCEQVPGEAERVNALIPEKLAELAAMRGIKLVQISTDAVFDGKTGGYTESDEPSPLNVYARTKLGGETRVMQKDPNALICRVNFYGWSISGRRSLAEWVFNKLSAGEMINGFTDTIFSPFLATDLARILIALVEKRCSGLYHVVNPTGISKYAFALAIARQFGFDETQIVPASIHDAGLRAARSPNLNLDSSKLVRELGEEIPDHQIGILRFHRQYLDGYPEQLQHYSENMTGGSISS